MTKLRLAALAGVAALGVSAAGVASAQGVSMGYVDSLQWKINHAFDQGMFGPGQRVRLLSLQQQAHDLAWRCNQGSRWACRKADDNIRVITGHLNQPDHDYGYRYHRAWRR